jgi:hypothetical protein
VDLLRRRHGQLKEKYDEAIKKNKEYAQDLFKVIKENSELKEAAETDAETLTDTLGINQVLVEEIKVKDKIIKANELLNNLEKNAESVIIDDTDDKDDRSNTKIIKCSKCSWTSDSQSQLPGHMLKHTGQYTCELCKQIFETKPEVDKHKKEKHVKIQDDEVSLVCITCDGKFQNEHSLKQQMQSKHKNGESIPVGHPDRYKKKNSVPKNIT